MLTHRRASTFSIGVEDVSRTASQVSEKVSENVCMIEMSSSSFDRNVRYTVPVLSSAALATSRMVVASKPRRANSARPTDLRCEARSSSSVVFQSAIAWCAARMAGDRSSVVSAGARLAMPWRNTRHFIVGSWWEAWRRWKTPTPTWSML